MANGMNRVAILLFAILVCGSHARGAGPAAVKAPVPIKNSSPAVQSPKPQIKSPTPHQESSPSISPKVRDAGKIDVFIQTVPTAKSLDALSAVLTSAGFTEAELQQLKRRIEATPSLRLRISQLQQDSKAAVKVRIGGLQAKARADLEAMKARAERGVVPSPAKGSYQAPNGLRFDPDACQADLPSIKEISGQLTPLSEFWVRGEGFGSTPGKIDVMTQGRIYRATITPGYWNSCIVYATLGGIEGVRASEAIVVLETNSGKKAEQRASFTPTIEFRSEGERLELCGNCCGNSEDWRVFTGELVNDWYVLGTSLDYHNMYKGDVGHAEITSAPDNLIPNINSNTKVHAGVKHFNCIWVHVYQGLAGPKGLPHHY